MRLPIRESCEAAEDTREMEREGVAVCSFGGELSLVMESHTDGGNSPTRRQGTGCDLLRKMSFHI